MLQNQSNPQVWVVGACNDHCCQGSVFLQSWSAPFPSFSLWPLNSNQHSCEHENFLFCKCHFNLYDIFGAGYMILNRPSQLMGFKIDSHDKCRATLELTPPSDVIRRPLTLRNGMYYTYDWHIGLICPLNLLPSNNLDKAVGGNVHLLVKVHPLRLGSLNTQGKIVTGLGSTGLYCFQAGVWANRKSNVERHLEAHDRVDKLLQDGGDVAVRESLPCPLI